LLSFFARERNESSRRYPGCDQACGPEADDRQSCRRAALPQSCESLENFRPSFALEVTAYEKEINVRVVALSREEFFANVAARADDFYALAWNCVKRCHRIGRPCAHRKDAIHRFVDLAFEF